MSKSNKPKTRISQSHYIEVVKRDAVLARWLLESYENYENLPPVAKRAKAEKFKIAVEEYLNFAKLNVKATSSECWLSRLCGFIAKMRSDYDILAVVKMSAAQKPSASMTIATPTPAPAATSTPISTPRVSLGVLKQLVKRRDSGQLNESQRKEVDGQLALCSTDQLLQLTS